ncbi:MAG: helix-turn-helix domain-containing protein [Puniceicoccales bacterium]|nr:helix-turn-helix domain-containing protein [Puniceicoccales bacterium]
MDATIFKELRTSEPLNLGSGNGNNAKYKLLNTEEAAEFLGITKYTLINWLSTKRYPGLKSIKLGGARRFREQDLAEFIESRICTTTVDSTSNRNQNPNSKNFKPSREGVL